MSTGLLAVNELPEAVVKRKLIAVPSLTGVRGLTTVWVALHHIYGTAATLLLLPWLADSSLLANGYRGVDLFFVLSGFILMRAHGTDFRTLRGPALYRFGLARFFRIYPLNTIVLLAMVPLVLLEPGFVTWARAFTDPHFSYKIHNLSAAGFVQSFLLVQTFTVAKLGEWNLAAWSLSAELLGYILFPFLAFVLMRQRSALLCNAGAVLCLTVLLVVLVVAGHGYNNPTGLFGSVRMLGCFTAGMFAHRAIEVGRRSLGPHAGSFLTICAVLLIALTMIHPRLVLLDNFGFLMLIVGLAYQAGPVDWLLRTRPFLWMGKISFSFYMIQEATFRVFVWAFEKRLQGVPMLFRALALIAVVAACVMCAWALFNLVEKPSHRLGRRLAQPLQDRWERRSRRASSLPAGTSPT